jgi:hypothetical protein
MKPSMRLIAVLAVAVVPFIATHAAAADPSGENVFPPFEVSCTSGDTFLVSAGDLHNRSTQAFVANDTSILIIRTLSIDGTVVFDRAVNANSGSYTTCTGADSIGEEVTFTGFITPRT